MEPVHISASKYSGNMILVSNHTVLRSTNALDPFSSGHHEIQDGRRQILVCIVNSSEKLLQ